MHVQLTVAASANPLAVILPRALIMVGAGKPWWTGEYCSLLNFEPAASVQQGIYEPGVSTWGGSVIKSEVDGLYHAHAAEMLEGCGISSWTHNSQSVHFTAEDPLGPYTRKAVAQPRCSHNPSATVLPDGSWLLFHLGMGI
eukprot:COSAG02_NODE_15626_length_1154_cov_1.003791_1_plen_140_part_01